MLVVAGASLVAVFLDPRIITGAPAWLKPFKFAISTAVYSLTLAWIFTWLADWPRVRHVVGWTTAIVFVLEVAIIDAQAWRGTTSHFNVSTPLNAVLFFVMGGAILIQTLVSVAVAVALWLQRFNDRVLGWALRLGMTLTIVGALIGPVMTRPTAAQLADARAGRRMTTAGAHSVGGADGTVNGWQYESLSIALNSPPSPPLRQKIKHIEEGYNECGIRVSAGRKSFPSMCATAPPETFTTFLCARWLAEQ
jgi:hypothetical protein